MSTLSLSLTMGAVGGPKSLAARALSAIRRNGGTLLLPGAATPNGDGTFSYGNPPLRNYLDSAGTDLLDSVTQVDQPVGLALDSMGVLGAELVTSQDLSTWTSGGAFGNWGASTATNDTITSTAANGARYQRFAVSPGTTFMAGAVVSKVGTATGVRISVVFGTSSGVYISATPASTSSTTPTPLTVIGTAPSNAAFCEIVIRADGVAGSQGTFTSISVREIPGNHASQPTTANKGILRRTSGRYRWEFDATDSLVVTLPAGFNSATTIDARSTGHVTLQNQNIVGAYSIGPSITSFGRIILPSSPSASDLALLQRYANWLAGVSA